MHTNLLQLCKSRDNLLSGMTMNMMLKFEKYWSFEVNQNFFVVYGYVLDPHLKLKYVKFYFSELYDYDKAQLLTKKVKDNLVSLLY
jgi:hypothetical protein